MLSKHLKDIATQLFKVGEKEFTWVIIYQCNRSSLVWLTTTLAGFAHKRVKNNLTAIYHFVRIELWLRERWWLVVAHLEVTQEWHLPLVHLRLDALVWRLAIGINDKKKRESEMCVVACAHDSHQYLDITNVLEATKGSPCKAMTLLKLHSLHLINLFATLTLIITMTQRISPSTMTHSYINPQIHTLSSYPDFTPMNEPICKLANLHRRNMHH